MQTFETAKDALAQARTRMEKSVEDLRKEIATLRTGRANVSLLDHIRVDYHGTAMPINQLGTLAVPEPTLIVVTPWDKAVVPAIEKAVRSADLGFNPQNDGKIIRIPVPALTEERRKEMVKHLHKGLEEHRTAIRNVRRDGNDEIKKAMKDKKISEDEERGALERVAHLAADWFERHLPAAPPAQEGS